MNKYEYCFEFLSMDEQKVLIKEGEFIDSIIEEDFNTLLFLCEKDYFVEAFIPVGESEIDFISLASQERLQKYKIDN